MLLGACASVAVEGPESYIVRAHDTLYSIAWRHELDFRDLARWNNIGPDFHIAIGQVLLLSGPPRSAPLPRPAIAAPPVTPAWRPNEVPFVGKPQPLPSAAAPPGAPSAAALEAPIGAGIAGRDRGSSAVNGPVKWVWPTDHVAAPRSVAGGGILLAGRLGQNVRAASAGRVVYTGSGLRGYGNLIIIKHADSLLSAYAHNREMLVHDGQEVTAGQVIAHMGQGAKQMPLLYFEIRQNGKPVDPLPFLSR
ncbi:MAG: peptidoglycan DD-metalloendopeptidase family protein [Gammaproteobacteria bacterium]